MFLLSVSHCIDDSDLERRCGPLGHTVDASFDLIRFWVVYLRRLETKESRRWVLNNTTVTMNRCLTKAVPLTEFVTRQKNTKQLGGLWKTMMRDA